MISSNFEYSSPATLDEALRLLASGEAKVLAGGMSLIPMMKLRLAAPERLVDLGRISGLNSIAQSAGEIRIGALATHYEVESSALLRKDCPLLAATASNIGDVQVRNMGTIGGSIAHADPAADYPAALQALEAKIVLAKAGGSRTVPVDAFLVDTFTTSIEPGEIVREIVVSAEAAGAGVSYQKMLQPASGFAIVGVAARMRRANGKISFARIGVTGLGSKAFRATSAEAKLTGTTGSDADIATALATLGDGIDANSDIHASANYRKHMAKVYAARAIRAALGRAS